jgi:nitrogen fixation NifU-like protein
MDDLAQENILDHYKYPRNRGVLVAPTASHEVLNPLCGDRVRIDIFIVENMIEDIRFSGRGCTISQAMASMLTETLLKQSVEAARAMNENDVLDLLGIPIGIARLKCATLSLKALQAALDQVDGGTWSEEA